MMTVLFWNSKHAKGSLIGKLVAEHGADVLVLTESSVDANTVLDEIEKADGTRFAVDPQRENVAIYTRFPGSKLGHEYEERHLSIRRIHSTPTDILLVAVHLLSKDSASDAEQAALTPGYAYEIRRIEKKLGHRRTLLVGDLNMNPFDDGMIQATGFQAVPSHRIATERGKKKHKGERAVQKRYYPFFYNPMWNCFGDERGGPPGTFFRDKADIISHFWHMYDQVLLRPALVDKFVHKDLKILSHCGSIPLVNGDGVPDRDNASDHLPILFRLDFDSPGAIP
jgi:hypothetical protein